MYLCIYIYNYIYTYDILFDILSGINSNIESDSFFLAFYLTNQENDIKFGGFGGIFRQTLKNDATATRCHCYIWSLSSSVKPKDCMGSLLLSAGMCNPWIACTVNFPGTSIQYFKVMKPHDTSKNEISGD